MSGRGGGLVRNRLLGRGERAGEPEHRPLSDRAVETYLAAHALDEFLGDAEPQTGTALLAGVGAVRLRERREDVLAERQRDADSSVDDKEPDELVLQDRLDGHDTFGVGELAGIGQEVVEDLCKPRLVGLDEHVVLGQFRLDPDAEAIGEQFEIDRRLAIAHLGNGASVTAVLNGRGHASSMGFSTIDGLAMGTRSGRIDPGVLFYLHDRGMTQAQIEDLLYRKSGLLGLSGLSNDMRDLMASDDPAAVRAVEYFVARAVEEIARLAATMGGLDTVVFCGGIGENAGEIRDRIAAGLTFLPGQGDGVEILTRETREEEEILRAVAELCGHS